MLFRSYSLSGKANPVIKRYAAFCGVPNSCSYSLSITSYSCWTGVETTTPPSPPCPIMLSSLDCRIGDQLASLVHLQLDTHHLVSFVLLLLLFFFPTFLEIDFDMGDAQSVIFRTWRCFRRPWLTTIRVSTLRNPGALLACLSDP